MSSPSSSNSPPAGGLREPTAGGLRERKKARTRAAIQEQAFRLFVERGYGATTVEQIAEAADISPSTFFRYFPNKEAVAFKDEIEPRIVESFLAQPAGTSAIRAFRAAVQAGLATLSDAELVAARDRHVLIWDVPELRAAALENIGQSMRLIADLAARRVGRTADDFAVRTFAGAVFGVVMSVNDLWARQPDSDMAATLDSGLALLEAGLPL
ncbi:MAG: TetR family transcriptional regulator [Frankia sp.]